MPRPLMRPLRRLVPPVAAVALLTTALVACGGEDSDNPAPDSTADVAGTTETAGTPEPEPAGGTFPMTLDSCGEEVTLDVAPETVLTIGSSALALLDAAGAGDRVVARAGEFDAPLPESVDPALADVPVVDPGDPSLEVILGTEADLLLGYGLFAAAPEEVAAAGVETITIAGECGGDPAAAGGASDTPVFDLVLSDIEAIGEVFGTGQQALLSAADLTERIDAVRTGAQGAPPMTAAGVYFFGGALSVTGAHDVLHDQMTVLGITDAFADTDERFLETGIETLLDADPDSIILAYGTEGDTFEQALAQLTALPGAENLRALRNDQVYPLPFALRQPDPAAVTGLETLAEATGRQ